MMVVGTDLTGKLVHFEAYRDMVPSEDRLRQTVAQNAGLPADQVLVWIGPDDPAVIEDPNNIVVDIQGGQIVEVSAKSRDYLYLHVNLSGGDNDPGIIGIVNDGVNALTVDVTMRFGPADTDQVVLITHDWRITVRDDKGHVYDIVRVGLVDGQASFNYTTTGPPAVCHLDETDLQEVTIPINGVDYLVKLAKPVQFKVYRSV